MVDWPHPQDVSCMYKFTFHCAKFLPETISVCHLSDTLGFETFLFNSDDEE